METDEKLTLIIGASVIVISIAGVVIIDRLVQKREKRISEEYTEKLKQQGWEMIQRSRTFENASPEYRIMLFDSYWKTTGGVKPHTP